MESCFEVHRNHKIRARDGVELAGDLYLPGGGGKVPVIVIRTPYGKEAAASDFLDPLACVDAGFAVYVQDLRGFGRSGGRPNFAAWDEEAEDAWDTLDHLANQPWSSGAAGMAGASFLGMVQLAALAKPHPSLRAIAPAMLTVQPYERRATAPFARFGETFLWVARMIVQTAARDASGEVSRLSPGLQRLAHLLGRRHELFALLRDEGLPAEWRDLEHGALAGIVSGTADFYLPGRHFQSMSLPALVTTGWYDTFATPSYTLGQDWVEISPAAARSRLYVGPWSHSNHLLMNLGQVNFDVAASGPGFGVERQHLDFFAAELDGRDVRPAPSSEYVLFGGRWRGRHEAGGEARVFTLKPASGTVCTLRGERDPTPTLGGQTHFNTGGAPGPVDQRPLYRRSDSALLVGPALDADVEIAGSARMALVSVEGTQSGFVAKLCLVDPNEAVFPVQEGMFGVGGVQADGGFVFPRCRFLIPAGWRPAVSLSLGSYPRLVDPAVSRGDRPLCAGAGDQALSFTGPFGLVV